VSASSLRRVAVGTQQQRNVQVRVTAANLKRDLHNRIQTFHAASGEVARDVKRQAMRPFLERCTFRQQFAASSVQNVSRNLAHPVTHFLSRMCMICRCSSAACCSSVASSLCNRRRRISRISLADFPVAQTIKIRPNFCSYSRLPHFSAIFTASSAVAAFSCSCSDQVEDCAGASFSALVSPMRG